MPKPAQGLVVPRMVVVVVVVVVVGVARRTSRG